MSVRGLLRQWGIRPNKGLGQNFLVDQAVLEKIAAAAELTPDDTVLEIGAGTGVLTKLLAREAGCVIAIELDQRLMTVLRSELSTYGNVTLVQGNILKLDPAALLGTDIQHPTSSIQYKVVANLPYYITSAVLRHLLEADHRPQRIVVTVQYEVAKRIVAEPGEMSLLAVSVQFYGHPELLLRIEPGSFYPSPEVESAVVRIASRPKPPLPQGRREDFFRVVRAGFSQRRKQLHNALSAGLGLQISRHEAADILEEAGVDPRCRAQTLTVEEWVRVSEQVGQWVGK